MIKELRIENFAIIDHLELVFSEGLTTFTGETGAGKSILLDAIEALMGGRAEYTMIRADAERANLEAVFAVPDFNRNKILAILDAQDLLDNEEEILFNREIRRNGRNTARLNGRIVSVSLMREIGSYLVDIHGQSEHLSLLTVRQHLHLLDRFAKNNALINAYQHIFEQVKEVRQQLAELREAERDAARQTDLLKYQIKEIEAAKLQPGEEEIMRRELSRLANAEKLASLAQNAYTLIEDSTPGTQSVSEMLGVISKSVHSLAQIDHDLDELVEQSETISSLTADISRTLQNYIEQIEYNPKRLEQTENRLALISTLKKKYGDDEQAVLEFARSANVKLENISHAEERIAELEEQESSLLYKLKEAACALSASRKEAAKVMSNLVERELSDLKMSGAQFFVSISHKADENGIEIGEGKKVLFNSSGIDRVEFMIAPNPGEGLKPLVKIASGGETSRLMLALKNVLASADIIPTLIFDEIDQGIGGRVGAVVGEKLWQLGTLHQVFCVTHLPQLAAYGNNHFHVRKEVIGGRTQTTVEKLTIERRLSELAQMFGGDNEANRAAAKEVLETASNFKNNLLMNKG
ncbi:MAG: DNA repair protein RecN [Anaerolineaceae bacterium]|nr:DNA repair protein RecN [Anaerolineaceae bacterium]